MGLGEADWARGVGQSVGVPRGGTEEGGTGERPAAGDRARGEMGREVMGDMWNEKEEADENDSGVDRSTTENRLHFLNAWLGTHALTMP